MRHDLSPIQLFVAVWYNFPYPLSADNETTATPRAVLASQNAQSLAGVFMIILLLGECDPEIIEEF